MQAWGDYCGILMRKEMKSATNELGFIWTSSS